MMDVFSLKGRSALVTGGSRGIGAGVVKIFLEAGARVAFCHYKDDVEAERFASELKAAGHEVFLTACDVGDPDAIAKLRVFVESKIGNVDIVVNAAGICGDRQFEEVSVADFDRMLDVNLRGTFLVTQAFFAQMIARGYGRVINFASQLAYKGGPAVAHYCASKGGVVGFTRALSYDGAPHGVTVNAIAPGPIETAQLAGMTDEWRNMKHGQLPIGRFGSVDEIAPTALLLASKAGSYYVGQTLSPNGGDVML